ncbi:SMP-30/gluconolactonase/LRE family protein [Actinomadura scrupuli]|uniref:SMP-30/gluconolactonase/LRE family protein n=1 Tax=Actinomadura scrupuli TaxID=559629 RepID=UPI003D958C65
MPETQIWITGLGLVESPRWHDGRLYFSDWTAHEVIALDLEGEHEVVARVDSLPLCTAWQPDGRLMIVDSRRGLLLRLEPDGSLVTHADLNGLGRGWNDMVIDGRGNTYVNGIGFDMLAGEAFAPGFVVHVGPGGSARAVADGVAFPNGMAVTQDNSTLIVAESYANRLTAFDIEADGGLSGRRVWAETGDDHPDGICTDAEGAVWYADVGNKRCVRVREGGEVLQTVDVDRGCFACVLGGQDGRTLFIVAAEWRMPEMVPPGTGRVLSVQVTVPGAGWP